jgi:hypothetical protein
MFEPKHRPPISIAPWILLISLGVLAVRPLSARADCTTDAECKGDRICEAGVCVAPTSTSCATDVDCPGDSICESATCVEAATSPTPPPDPAPVPPPPPLGPSAEDVAAYDACVASRADIFAKANDTTDAHERGRLFSGLPTCTKPTMAVAIDSTTATPSVQTVEGAAVTFTLAPPPKHAINFAMGGFGTYSNSGASLFGAGIDIAGHALVGLKPFPGSNGGNWNALRVDLHLQLYAGGLAIQIPYGDDVVGGLFAARTGIAVGYTYLHMRDLDLDYKQRGLGFSAMWRLGDQEMQTVFDEDEAMGASLSGFAHGPSFQLLFPTYGAHRGVLDYKFINVDIVFWRGLTMFQIGSGGTF